MIEKICLGCSLEFKPSYSKNVYCSRSCSAKVNNRKYPKRPPALPQNKCQCGKDIAYQSKQCKSCYNKARRHLILTQWKDNELTSRDLPPSIREYLIESANFACVKCGFDTLHPLDNKSVLEINHINGNGTDHSPNNLEVICPNCHALTNSYRGRNQGHGRPMTYLRRWN